jgi:hypothetical protein
VIPGKDAYFPTKLLVDASGKVLWVLAENDLRVREGPEEVLKAIDGVMPSTTNISPSQSGFVGPVDRWARVSVAGDSAWDPSSVAREASAEIEVAVGTFGALEVGELQPREPIQVRYVVAPAVIDAMVREVPGTDRVLRWGSKAYFHPAGRVLAFSREAEVVERAYLTSLALLTSHRGLPPIWFLDSLATWHAGLILNQLGGKTAWRRGRVDHTSMLRAEIGDLSAKQLEGIHTWGSRELPLDVDLEWPSRSMADLDLADAASGPSGDPVGRLRALSWFYVYFLQTFAATADGYARFDGTPTYRRRVVSLFAPRESRASIVAALLGDNPSLLRDYSAYFRFVHRKLGLGHVRGGVILAWDEFTNERGGKTGERADDALK